jgi:lipopolysaccharide/colanic/teichoic acid biosynthesis glycosyltransferase/FlaA1/EpsC-like NDP-sugar epimerase
MLIRILDIILSCLGLIVLGFLLPAIWILLRLDSKGQLFYLADRVGKDQKPFKMFKFRTMLDTPVQVGECLCPQFDPRVTRFGHFLRRTKINELPQMINILKGDMSFVGPRPEAPELAEVYPKEAKIVFSVKPGLVGPATIHGRNEEECYPVGIDVKQYYLDHLLPNKLKLDLEFVQSLGLANYLKFIILGVTKTISGVINYRQIESSQPQIYLLIADLVLIIAAYLFAYNFLVWQSTGVLEIIHSTRYLPVVIVVRLLCNQYFGLYRPLLKYLSKHDIFETVKANSSGTVFLLLVSFLLEKHSYSLLMASLDWFALNITFAITRIALIIYLKKKNRINEGANRSRILIYGACDEGYLACRSLISNSINGREVVGFIDDAEYRYGKTIYRKKILGNRYQIKDLVRLYNIDQVVIANPHMDKNNILDIFGLCAQIELKCGVLANTNGFNCSYIGEPGIRDIEIEDFIFFKQINGDHAIIKKHLKNKTVLINGSGGAMGIELCKRLIKLGCGKLLIIERYEAYLNELLVEISKDYQLSNIVYLLTNIDRYDEIENLFSEHRPNIVIQASLRKYSAYCGIKVGDFENINYNRNFSLANLTKKYNCDIFVMISSIYADEKGNEIEKSLRIAEIYLEKFFKNSDTRLIIPRICDIAENRGGIVSIISEQIKHKKPFVLPTINKRFAVMPKDDAAEFILKIIENAYKTNFNKRIFNCDVKYDLDLNDICKKIAKIYKIEIRSDTLLRISNYN